MSSKYKYYVGIVAISFFLAITFVPQDSFAAFKKSSKRKSYVISKKVVAPNFPTILKEDIEKLSVITEVSVDTGSDAVTVFDDSRKPISKNYQNDSSPNIKNGEPTGNGEGGLGGQDGNPETGGIGGFYLMETLPYNKYVNPASPQRQFTLKVGDYTGTQL